MIGRGALTALGAIDFQRRAWRCSNPDCGTFVAPLDRELGLAPKDHVTMGAREKIALAGATKSFRDAELILDRLAGLPACEKEVQRITLQEGRRAVELIEEQLKQARNSPVCAEKHNTLILEMDGTCVLTQPGGPHAKTKAARGDCDPAPEPPKGERSRGKEIKCATVFGLDQRVTAPHRPALTGRRYAASTLGIGLFASMIYALLLSCGARKARRIAVLGDGAIWIWEWVRAWLIPWCSSGVIIIEIVDFWHAAERLCDLAKKLFGEGTDAAKQWSTEWRHRLKEGGIDELMVELARLDSQWKSGKRHGACTEQLRFFTRNIERMRYDKFAKQGLPIGSGAIEGTCKNLVKKRMAACGMHWRPDLIEPMIALRTVLFNEDWGLLYPDAA